MHFSRYECAVVSGRVRTSIYLSAFITPRPHLFTSLLVTQNSFINTSQAPCGPFVVFFFFFSGTLNPFSPLCPANSHHFYLPCPQPSRLLLFPYSIMSFHLGENSSYYINLSCCKTVYFQQQAQYLASSLFLVHIYLKECSLHFLMPSHIYSLLCPHGRGHCLQRKPLNSLAKPKAQILQFHRYILCDF